MFCFLYIKILMSFIISLQHIQPCRELVWEQQCEQDEDREEQPGHGVVTAVTMQTEMRISFIIIKHYYCGDKG